MQYTYKRTGTGTMAGGQPTAVYTAYSNGQPVATAARWVTHAGSNTWGATSSSNGATGSGPNRNTAVAAALAKPTGHTPSTAHRTRTSLPRCGCLYCTGCTACGLVLGQHPACTTACNPTAPCPVCGQHTACTACGQCYGCGLCATCRPCTACTACMGNANGPVACHACWGASHNGTHTH